MSRFLGLAALVVSGLLGSAGPLLGDEVLLTDGTKIAGKVTSETKDSVTIETADGVKTVARNRVSSIVKGGKPDEKPDASHDGKVLYKGRWMAPSEKADLEAGRILYKGQWVLPDEKKLVDKGLIRYKLRWVTPDERDMLEKGMARYQGKWLKREEVEAIRRNWEHAWEIPTKRYVLRTNTSEETAYEVLALLEAGADDFKKLLHTDKAEPDQPMVVHLYREASEFEQWCQQKESEAFQAQPDFYETKENILALCQRDLPKTVFYPWIVGAAFSQFTWTCYRTKLPDWFEYGVRCYYQGGKLENGRLITTGAYKALLPKLQAEISTGQHLKLRELIGTSASTVAATDAFTLFQAQAWALIYFFQQTPDEKWKRLFAKLASEYLNAEFAEFPEVSAINELGRSIFEKLFAKEIDALETQWVEFMRKLD